MKKMMFLSVLLLSVAFGYAQDSSDNGGFKRGGGNGEMREKMKQKLKDQLSLTDIQTDSVMSIQKDFQNNSKMLHKNSGLSSDDMQTKMKDLETQRHDRLKAILSDDQVTKLEAMYEKMKKMREQKQNQGSTSS